MTLLSKPTNAAFEPLYSWWVEHKQAKKPWLKDEYYVFGLKYNGPHCSLIRFDDFRPFFWLLVDDIDDHTLSLVSQQLTDRVRKRLFEKVGDLLKVPWEDYKRNRDADDIDWRKIKASMTSEQLDEYNGTYGIANKALIETKIIMRENLMGYEPTSPTDATRKKHKYMKVKCLNKAALDEASRMMQRSFKVYHPYSSGGGVKCEVKLPVYEANMKMHNRFQYRTHLKPCSWFYLKPGSYKKVISHNERVSNCKTEYKATYKGIVPSKDIPETDLYTFGIPNHAATPIMRVMVMDTEHAGKAGFPRNHHLEDHIISLGHVYVDKRPVETSDKLNKEIFVYANPDSDKFTSSLKNRRREGLVKSIKIKKKIFESIMTDIKANPDKIDKVDPQVRAIIQDMENEYDEVRKECGRTRNQVDVEIDGIMNHEDTLDSLLDLMAQDPSEEEIDDERSMEDEEDLVGTQLGQTKEEEVPTESEPSNSNKRRKTMTNIEKRMNGTIKDVKVYLYDSPLKTYEGWLKRLKELDPDIVMTYNGDKFDWAKLYIETMMHAAESPAKIEALRLSRLKDEVCVVESKRFNSRSRGENQYMRTRMTGRLVYDLFDYMKNTYRRKSYSLNAMLAFMKLPLKDEVTIKDINKSTKEGGDLLAKVLEYCCVDCERTLQLSDKTNFVVQMVTVANTTYTQVPDLAEGGNSKKSMNLICYESRCSKLIVNYVPPSKKPPGQFRWEEKITGQTKWYRNKITVERKPTTKEEFMRWFPKGSIQWKGTWRKKDGVYSTLIKTSNIDHKADIERRLIERGLVLVYNGATVIDPVKGLHDCCCPTLDFSSLYPSILIAYNLCYMTLIKKAAYLTWACMKDLFTIHEITKDRIHYFVKQSLCKGIIPIILERLIKTRKLVQAQMEYEVDPAKRLALDVFQLVLKIVSNALYGFQGFMFGPLPQMESAETVTFRGRTGLLLTKKVVEETDLRELLTKENWEKFVTSERAKHSWPITWYPEEDNLQPEERDGRNYFRPRIRPNKFDCPERKVCPCPIELKCVCARKKHCLEAKDGSLRTLQRMRNVMEQCKKKTFEINPETNRFYEDRINKRREKSSEFKFVWDTYGPLCRFEEIKTYLRQVPELMARDGVIDSFTPYVIYGDTDSVMCKFPLTTDRHGRRLAVMSGMLLAIKVTLCMVMGLNLAYEKNYGPILSSKKKRYAGNKWMSPDDLDPKPEVKGFQNQRRDFVPMYSSFLDACIDAILKDRNYDNVLIKEAKLKDDTINLSNQDKLNAMETKDLLDIIKNFEQSKSHKGFYANDTVIQAVAAKQKLEDGSGETLAGDRIYFFFGDTGNPKHKTYQKVIESTRAINHLKNKTLPPGFVSIIDHIYYLEHFLQNPYVALMTPYCGSSKVATERFKTFVQEIEAKKKGYKSVYELYPKNDKTLDKRAEEDDIDEEEIIRRRKVRIDRLRAESEKIKRRRPARRTKKNNHVNLEPKETESLLPTSKLLPRRIKKPVETITGPMDIFVSKKRTHDQVI